ncbi:hypothetical protein CFOL_v3_00041 [Cephalotus follicularis]|uniref:Uncharacterized protein n=1 Tax=Cephalotus follicularis TaxID=3775 RepID=A0A1Q3AL78_CEPFO|nr:hypothetical protein CFOL_v3_00041 [Cephalotus follicularis]
MNLSQNDLMIVQSPLVGFTGDTQNPEGVVSLPVTIEEEPCQVTIFVSFFVIKMPPTYNVILDHPFQAALKALVSIPYLNMKFLTSRGMGVAKGEALPVTFTSGKSYLANIQTMIGQVIQKLRNALLGMFSLSG